MSKVRLFLVFLLVPMACGNNDVTRFVDPNIGGVAPLLTTKCPTVHRPHSMVRVFPVTKPGLSDRYLSDRIYGFGLNMPAYRMGHVTSIMPVPGELSFDPDATASSYDHDLEDVHPWKHTVFLEDHDIVAEWTTSERAVVYRFVFRKDVPANVIFRSAGQASFRIRGNNTIRGWEEFRNTKQYFHAEFSLPFDSRGTFNGSEIIPGSDEADGRGTGACISFFAPGQPLEVRIGISYIDEDQARENLEREMKGKTFEKICDESYRIWKDALGKIYAEGGTERQMRIFYTSLYRCFERMVNISEYGRYYSGYDRKVHNDEGKPFYVDDWLWDTFRSQHPLLYIIEPDKQLDMAQSYVRMYEQSGWMPTFPQFYGDFSAMIGFHSTALVWDIYQKGGRDFDVEKAYEGFIKNAMKGTLVPWRSGPMCGLDSFYIQNGWFPALPEGAEETEPLVDGFEKRQAVAVTLEHSYDDWCLAQLAKALGKNEDYEYFSRRAQNYRNVYNPETGFMAPKMADGNWVEPFDPTLSGGIGSRMYFAENNAWIWNFSVMHDIPSLIELIGGAETFTDRLDRLFNEPTGIAKWQFMGQFPDASGLNGMFPAGNEPSFHVPYLYNYAGKPWKTQRRIKEVMELWFDDDPLGLPGDEDGGALCAWYVLSAMGFYPVTPGNGLYAIGTPFFKKVSINLPDGKIFTIKARNISKKNKYIQSAKLNGKPFDRAWIRHSEITGGGTLEFVMGDRPNREWGNDPAVLEQLTADN
ncbi:MAG TPA: GH92 family glycosyl hydrolase [Bacteroidales bacterium]|jgi:predicted alpha-1,2-mannosidase|nr:GH92 family glycosyl hydrolase [Bacteroidales bacterium]HOS71184.1 GH92 family glycosyl hydrolase [Bacteroidales bacterium]HQH22765.1 GH92 family glycosyl hydrolase [Bacteroidales bacterium]HQJ83514.1 GH92 family glycosyl hydrolase [Bacteroidales bacterium]